MSKGEYETIDAEEQRIKYIYRTERNIKLISYDKEDENGTVLKDIIPDSNYNIENDVARKIELERLNKVLLMLNDYEYNLIKALFFEQKSLREYSKIVGKHWTCIQDDRNKIFDKLKKIIKI